MQQSIFNSKNTHRIVTEQRILAVQKEAEEAVNYFIAYPDKLVDMLTPDGSNFKLFFYQRMYLRLIFRFRYMFATFTRAFSKSFLAILGMYLRCILLPGTKVFICADKKEQAAKIATEKIKELWMLFPLLKEELSDKVGERPSFDKDSVRLTFKNGSLLDVVGVLNSARGGRRHGGVIEEAALIDGDLLSEVVLPLMVISRRTRSGDVNPRENHQCQLYVTTAGSTATFAYEKMIQFLAWSVARPRSAFVWGGSYKIPVLHGLINEEYIDELQQDSSFKVDSFNREYLSIWSRSQEGSFFKQDRLDRHRTIKYAEYQASKKAPNTFYVISVDVGRLVAQTVAVVYRVNIRETYYLKNVVNIYTFQDMHFSHQAAKIKELVSLYGARQVVIDGAGLGVGLLDFMIQNTVCPDTGRTFGPLGCSNDSDYISKQPIDAPRLIHVIKANNVLLKDIHANTMNQINAGRVRFLVNEKVAKQRLLETQSLKNMKPEQKSIYLIPYELTSILITEMTNQRLKNQDGQGIDLERISRRIGQDKFSAFEYGLWFIKDVEEKYYKKLRKKKDMKQFIMLE